MIAAFFDIDGTLIKDNSLVMFIKYLMGIGYITRWEGLQAWWLYKRYSWNMINKRSLSKIMKFIEGKSVDEVKKLIDTVFDLEIKPKISKKMKQKIKWHKAKNHRIVILTTTPEELGENFRKEIGAKDMICSKLSIKKNYYEGKFDFFNYRRAKMESLEKYAKKNKIDLSKSYAYADSFSDVAALRKVGNPIAVNPDSKLQKYAKKHGWPVIKS